MIAANHEQLEEWKRLFAIHEIKPAKGDLPGVSGPAYSEPLSAEFLKANDRLVVDTRFFDEEFKWTLLEGMEQTDDQIDGLLVNSENFQALQLLQERYRERVKCVYIDPPYNTGGDGFLYSDKYQHSSWLTMVGQALATMRGMLPPRSASFISIDDGELPRLQEIASLVFGGENQVATIIWQKKYSPANDAKSFSTDQDYIITLATDREQWFPTKLPRSTDQDTIYKNPDDDPRGPWISDNYTSNKSRSVRPSLYYPITQPNTGEPIWPAESRVWAYSPEEHRKHVSADRIWSGKDGTNSTPRYKRFLSEVGDRVPQTLWSYKEVGHNQDAVRELKQLFGLPPFASPKPTALIKRIARVSGASTMIDFFAGSGTTGHAVINLNREDDGNRKYILVEMKEYFDTVLKPRIAKVVYSTDWKDGKPQSRDSGVSQIVKVIRLESYEDTLNNLQVAERGRYSELIDSGVAGEFSEGYMLDYMLDWEAGRAGLSVESFRKPFDYHLNIATDTVGESRPIQRVHVAHAVGDASIATRPAEVAALAVVI